MLRAKKSLTVQLNSSPVRKIELYTNVCIELCSVGIVGRSGIFLCYSSNSMKINHPQMVIFSKTKQNQGFLSDS